MPAACQQLASWLLITGLLPQLQPITGSGLNLSTNPQTAMAHLYLHKQLEQKIKEQGTHSRTHTQYDYSHNNNIIKGLLLIDLLSELHVSSLSETESSARETRLRGGEVSEASVSTAGDSAHRSAAPRMDEIMK